MRCTIYSAGNGYHLVVYSDQNYLGGGSNGTHYTVYKTGNQALTKAADCRYYGDDVCYVYANGKQYTIEWDDFDSKFPTYFNNAFSQYGFKYATLSSLPKNESFSFEIQTFDAQSWSDYTFTPSEVPLL